MRHTLLLRALQDINTSGPVENLPFSWRRSRHVLLLLQLVLLPQLLLLLQEVLLRALRWSSPRFAFLFAARPQLFLLCS